MYDDCRTEAMISCRASASSIAVRREREESVDMGSLLRSGACHDHEALAQLDEPVSVARAHKEMERRGLAIWSLITVKRCLARLKRLGLVANSARRPGRLGAVGSARGLLAGTTSPAAFHSGYGRDALLSTMRKRRSNPPHARARTVTASAQGQQLGERLPEGEDVPVGVIQ